MLLQQTVYELERGKVVGWLSDSMLFYGGLAFAGLAIVGSIGYFLAYKLERTKLEAQMDKEYGEE